MDGGVNGGWSVVFVGGTATVTEEVRHGWNDLFYFLAYYAQGQFFSAPAY